jgi:hypothetical protein
MFAGWFRMNKSCEHCGFPFEREPGFYLGSIYVNYGLTAWTMTVSFMVLFLGFGYSPDVLLWPEMAFCVLFPLWFHRYARAIWIAFDYYWDPPAGHPLKEAPASQPPNPSG